MIDKITSAFGLWNLEIYVALNVILSMDSYN